MNQLEITYLNHSGFRVTCDGACMIFDYYPGDEREAGMPGVITSADLEPFDQVLVFVSHSHEDHLDRSIFDWRRPGVSYIMSEDVLADDASDIKMLPGDERQIGDIKVKAFDSTDLGVSFLVSMGNINIFHAGDLNLWHWREASTVREIAQAEEAFYAAMKPIEGHEIDVAFFPVDPRQGSFFDAGALHFMMAIKPTLLIPMHFQGRGAVATEFARKYRSRKTEIIAMIKRGDTIAFSKQDELEAELSLAAGLSSFTVKQKEKLRSASLLSGDEEADELTDESAEENANEVTDVISEDSPEEPSVASIASPAASFVDELTDDMIDDTAENTLKSSADEAADGGTLSI